MDKNRISKMEEYLDITSINIKELKRSINKFKKNKKKIYEVSNYYGSNDWFDDRDDFDKGKLKNIKAGVLSEDAVWLLNEYVRDLIDRLRTIVDDYDVRIKKKNKNCNCSKDCKCGCHKKNK